MGAGHGRAVNANGRVLGDLAGHRWGRSRPGPALAGTPTPAATLRPLFQGPPPGLCPSHGDSGEHLLQAAQRLNIRANLDQQVL